MRTDDYNRKEEALRFFMTKKSDVQYLQWLLSMEPELAKSCAGHKCRVYVVEDGKDPYEGPPLTINPRATQRVRVKPGVIEPATTQRVHRVRGGSISMSLFGASARIVPCTYPDDSRNPAFELTFGEGGVPPRFLKKVREWASEQVLQPA